MKLLKRVLRPLVALGTSLSSKVASRVWGLQLASLGEEARISTRARIYVGKCVSVGDRTVINDFVHIWGGGTVFIGPDCLIAAHVVIASQSHAADALSMNLLYRETQTAAPVRIGSNVWIGSNATILPGVSIGSGAIVAAGAVVTRDIPENTLAVGVPARAVRTLK